MWQKEKSQDLLGIELNQYVWDHMKSYTKATGIISMDGPAFHASLELLRSLSYIRTSLCYPPSILSTLFRQMLIVIST